MFNTPLESIKCPDSIKIDASKTYECQAKAQGSDFKINVTPSGKGTEFNWKMTEPTLEKASVESAIKQQFGQKVKGELSEISCPGFILSKVGTEYQCQAKAAEVAFTVQVKPTGEDAKFQWEVVEPMIDGKFVESSIQQQFEQKTKVALDEIACPPLMPSKAGGIYDCKGSATGTHLTIQVKPTGENFGFAWEVTRQEASVPSESANQQAL